MPYVREVDAAMQCDESEEARRAIRPIARASLVRAIGNS